MRPHGLYFHLTIIGPQLQIGYNRVVEQKLQISRMQSSQSLTLLFCRMVVTMRSDANLRSKLQVFKPLFQLQIVPKTTTTKRHTQKNTHPTHHTRVTSLKKVDPTALYIYLNLWQKTHFSVLATSDKKKTEKNWSRQKIISARKHTESGMIILQPTFQKCCPNLKNFFFLVLQKMIILYPLKIDGLG